MGLEDEAPPALDHVQVAAPAGCEARARWFYGELLGLDEVEKPSPLAGRGGVWFALASGAQLHVGVADGFAAAAEGPSGAAGARRVAPWRRWRHRLAAARAAVTWDDELPGVRRFFTADPFGNRLELLARRAVETAWLSKGGTGGWRRPAGGSWEILQLIRTISHNPLGRVAAAARPCLRKPSR